MTVAARSQTQALLNGLHAVLGTPAQPLALHEPEFGGNEDAYLKECVASTFVSSVGKYVDQFERMLAEYTGAKHAVAVVNGTAALQIAMRLAGVERDDEVLVPALSFVATANAVAHCGAIPHFVDSSSVTMGLDPEALESHLRRVGENAGGGLRNRETGRRIAAIVPMHAFGHPVDINALLDVAGRFGLPIVEDAAESLGSTYRGKACGTFGLLGTLSFNGNKIVTTGGGGAILTDDGELARRAKHITTTAKRAHRWEFFHDEVAWNYRLPNLNAALGCAQMEQLPGFVERKRTLAHAYRAAFNDDSGIQFMPEPKGTHSNFWLNTVQVEGATLAQRDELLAAANDAGYGCRPVWTLMHRLPMYAASPRAELPVATKLEQTLINLPSSAKLAARLR